MTAIPTPPRSREASLANTHPLVLTLLALTVTTGIVDAVSYIGLGHVFTANMTGNVVLLGFGVAGAGGLPVLAPLISLTAFLLGALLAGKVAAELAERRRLHVSVALAVEAALVGCTAIVAASSTPHTGNALAYSIIATLALAMGFRNATVRRLNVADLTTTVLTMTLTGLASASAPGARAGVREQTRRLLAAACMLGGAAVGGLMVQSSLSLPLALTAATALVACAAYRVAAPARR